MAVRKTIQIGDSRLKAKNLIVKNFGDSRIKRVIKDLRDTMIKNDLIGLAAPQIGYNYRIFITQPRKTKARKLPKGDKLRVYINPRMAKYSEEKNIRAFSKTFEGVERGNLEAIQERLFERHPLYVGKRKEFGGI